MRKLFGKIKSAVKGFMQDLVDRNMTVFITGNGFIKFFMITIGMFCEFALVGKMNADSEPLINAGGGAWIMVVFFSLFWVGYFVRNHYMVGRSVKRRELGYELEKGEKKALEVLDYLKGFRR